MRGTHYGADYRWFSRFIGDQVTLPEVTVERGEAEGILSERGIFAQRSADDVVEPDAIGRASKRGGGRADGLRAAPEVTGGPPTVYGDALRERLGTPTEPHRPGSLKAAMTRARVAAEVVGASRREAPACGPQSEQVASSDTMRLAKLLEASTNPRELAEYSFDQLLAAFKVAGLNPAVGAKIVQAWGYSRSLAPEEVVSAMKRMKDEWRERADQGPSVPAPLLPEPRQWDYDQAVAEYLGQRNNVGRGPKDIDRERLMLLRRLMASFSGQANYGFTSVDAVAEAVSSTNALG